MGLTYRIPPNVQKTEIQGHPALITAQGGKIIMDHMMIDLWQQAHDQDVNDILTKQGSSIEGQSTIRAALACMAEAGLLVRDTGGPKGPQIDAQLAMDQSKPLRPTQKSSPALVSVIIVGHNSQFWLKKCIPPLQNQNHDNLEIIIVDNGSNDTTRKWLEENYRNEIKLIQLDQTTSLANAINQGVRHAHGEYLLLLNPDTIVQPDAIPHMLSAAQTEPRCAAVAAKLRFLGAPAFINGLGNYVGAISWGSDSALGHLDLGQFNHWDQLSSACFAAALIPRQAWEIIGPLDENFPLYYEDSEWCYRGRLFGYKVIAAPHAVVYHAFGSGQSHALGQLSPQKMQSVVYGRLRFVTKLLTFPRLLRFLISYIFEDWCRFLIVLTKGKWDLGKAYLRAWLDYIQSLESLILDRHNTQSQRKISDKALFAPQRQSPPPLVWRGYPQLTWDIVHSQYLKLFSARKAALPLEFNNVIPDFSNHSLWTRAFQIWKIEGPSRLLHHIGKFIQWRLSQP